MEKQRKSGVRPWGRHYRPYVSKGLRLTYKGPCPSLSRVQERFDGDQNCPDENPCKKEYD